MLFIASLLAFIFYLEPLSLSLQSLHDYFFEKVIFFQGSIMAFGAIVPGFIGLGLWLIPLMIGCSNLALPRLGLINFWVTVVGMLGLLVSFFLADSIHWLLVSIQILSFSYTVTAFIIFLTVLTCRTPDMPLMKLPLFCWSWLVGVILMAIVMLLDFFMIMQVHQSQLSFSEVFWFLGRPQVFLMVLLGFGIVSPIIPTFTKNFSFKTPVLFALGFIALFSLGGLYAVFSELPFRFILIPSTLFALFAGFYYWLPKWSGKMYHELLGKMHFGVFVLSIYGMCFPLQTWGMTVSAANLVFLASSFFFLVAQILFFYNLFFSLKRGKIATAQVWEGTHGLEWTIPSPAPRETFLKPPVIKK